MAEPWEWEEADLKSFVDNKATESLELDFKACASIDLSDSKTREKSKFELTKDVSAFANSAGGTLIYGIKEDERTHTAKELDAGYDPAVVNHEWIGQVVNTIQPRVPNVRIHTVPLGQHSSGRVAYVIHLPVGTTAYQANDLRYYKRYNFESVPMADYEIRDVMQRADAPSLRIESTIGGEEGNGVAGFSLEGDDLLSPIIELFAINEETAGIAEYAQYHVFWPIDVSLSESSVVFPSDSGQPSRTPISAHWSSKSYVEMLGETIALQYFDLTFAPGQLVLFPGERRWLASFRLRARGDAVGRGFHVVAWRIRAPRSGQSTGAVMFVRQSDGGWQFHGVTSLQEDDDAWFKVTLAP